MADPITSRLLPQAALLLRSPEPARPPDLDAPAGEAPGTQFIEMLRTEINKINDLQVYSDDASKALVTGETGDLHGTMLALTRADLSFRLMTQVRNKALDVYHEMMRMAL